MRFFFAIIAASGLCACSLYQSPSRKLLEREAYEYAGVSAQAHRLHCQSEASFEGWSELSRSSVAQVFEHESQEFTLRVQPTGEDFSCDFKFSSAQEMFEKLNAAIDLTLVEERTQNALTPSELE